VVEAALGLWEQALLTSMPVERRSGYMAGMLQYAAEKATQLLPRYRSAGAPPQKGQYRYCVKESEDGTCWIAPEPDGDVLKIIGPKGDDLGLGFTLRQGATLEEAHELAACMNRWIADIMLF
jgi:hypothetical protein